MKTIRRDVIKRLVEQGKLETVSTYHFDDMMGESRGSKTLPVAILPPDFHDRKEGICYLFPSDFTSRSGSAWINPDGTITLYVHSNSNYTLRRKDIELGVVGYRTADRESINR